MLHIFMMRPLVTAVLALILRKVLLRAQKTQCLFRNRSFDEVEAGFLMISHVVGSEIDQ